MFNPDQPNYKDLIIHIASIRAVPSDAGDNAMAIGLSALLNLKELMPAAIKEADQMIAFVQAAPNNPYGDDKEAIASAIMRIIKH